MPFTAFLLAALAAGALYLCLAPAATVWGALGAAALGWLGANLLLVLFVLLNPLRLPPRPEEGGVERQDPVCRWVCRVGARFLCGYAGVKLRMSGTEKLPEEPFLLVSNHRSIFDPLLVMGYFPRRELGFVSKPSVFRVGFVGKTAWYAGHLPIDRENDRAALRTILTAADYLKRGVCSMAIFPEGTRNRTDAPLLPFHAGSFKIAQRAGAPVVVVCMRGTEQIHKTLFFRRTPVELSVLEVVGAERVKAMKTVELADHAREIIEAKLKEDA